MNERQMHALQNVIKQFLVISQTREEEIEK